MDDVLQGCWEFVGDNCKKMVAAFWVDGKLSSNAVNGVVKMKPKKNESMEDLDY